MYLPYFKIEILTSDFMIETLTSRYPTILLNFEQVGLDIILK